MREVRIQSLGQEGSLEKELPSPIFLPGEFHEQRSLAGYRPWGHKELNTTEQVIWMLIHNFGIFISNTRFYFFLPFYLPFPPDYAVILFSLILWTHAIWELAPSSTYWFLNLFYENSSPDLLGSPWCDVDIRNFVGCWNWCDILNPVHFIVISFWTSTIKLDIYKDLKRNVIDNTFY